MLDESIQFFPAWHVQITDAKVRMIGDLQGLLQGGEKILLNIVENSGHGMPFNEKNGVKSILLFHKNTTAILPDNRSRLLG